MTLKELVRLRKQAEKAVSGMAEGELKVKAFEVIFNHLLGGSNVSGTASVAEGDTLPQPALKTRASTRSASGRILVLRDEGFFDTLRSMGEIREELGAHGWHYPTTSLSGVLMNLVGERRELRRQRVKKGDKKIWKYSKR